MRFIVATADGEERSYIGTLKFEESGVLRIDPDSPVPGRVWLSPAFWREITEDPSHHPLKGDYYHPFKADS
jgi:hypothetical protein